MKTIKVSDKAYRRVRRLLQEGEFKTESGAIDSLVIEALKTLPVSSNGLIDLQPAEDGARKTQKVWIAYFNDKKRAMISAPDVYRAGQKGSDGLLQSLQKDFDDWIVTGTRILYNPTDLSARVVHNFGSSVVKPAEIPVAQIPEYESEPATRVVESETGLKYVQALFQTQDNPKKILAVLEKLGRRSLENIRFWTPSQDGRKSYPERAVGFGYDVDGFHVDGYDSWDDGNYGRSRGVLINQTQTSRGKK